MVVQISLTEEQVKILAELKDLLEDILETIELLSDKELMANLEESLKDVREGRTRPLEEFLMELEKEEELT